MSFPRKSLYSHDSETGKSFWRILFTDRKPPARGKCNFIMKGSLTLLFFQVISVSGCNKSMGNGVGECIIRVFDISLPGEENQAFLY